MKISSLFSRILIAIIFVPILIFIILCDNPVYYYIIVSIAIMLALVEYFFMMSKRGIRPMWIFGLIFGFCFILFSILTDIDYSKTIMTIGIIMALTIKVLKTDYETHIPSLFMTIFGVIYVCWLGTYIIQVRFAFGSSFTLFLFAITWMNDTGAYFMGSLFGKHKLLPKVSPNKTVEGLIGGIVFSLLVGIISRPLLEINNFSLVTWLGICFLISMSAHFGDLGESLLKRFAGAGNSFNLLPGHGGILDKIDSLLFTSPVFYFIMQIK